MTSHGSGSEANSGATSYPRSRDHGGCARPGIRTVAATGRTNTGYTRHTARRHGMARLHTEGPIRRRLERPSETDTKHTDRTDSDGGHGDDRGVGGAGDGGATHAGEQSRDSA